MHLGYKEIHLWEFHPIRTNIRVQEHYRKEVLTQFLKKFPKHYAAADYLNAASKKYGINRKYNYGNIYFWINGFENGRNRNRNIPLWAAIEISKYLAGSENNDNTVMREIEKRTEFCCGNGPGSHVQINFPIYLTPELVSIIFHFCGDGHLADIGGAPSYRQVNRQGIRNFITKITNSFGRYPINEKQCNQSKVLIPIVINDFYKYYFRLGDCRWAIARIPEEIKLMDKYFLLAGLTAFLVDEGHISDNIEIYSGNKSLLEDIRDITQKLNYICVGPKFKSKTNHRDFRLLISLRSAIKFHKDIQELISFFPSCGLAHKQHRLEDIVTRQMQYTGVSPLPGVNQKKICNLLSNNSYKSIELARELRISISCTRRNLKILKKKNIVKKLVNKGKSAFLWEKVT